MMMDNLNFLTSFEPFEKFLKEEDNMKVGDWTIKIDFETEGKGYYIERPITI